MCTKRGEGQLSQMLTKLDTGEGEFEALWTSAFVVGLSTFDFATMGCPQLMHPINIVMSHLMILLAVLRVQYCCIVGLRDLSCIAFHQHLLLGFDDGCYDNSCWLYLCGILFVSLA